MYYFIFDPPQGPREYERVAQIKKKLTELGIVGEMASPMPGRSVEDLVRAAVTKRYGTVVAVGGIPLINQVARAVEPFNLVLGLVPLGTYPDISELIGATTWEVAADHLKPRRWQQTWLGEMNGSTTFLTTARIIVPSNQLLRVETPDFTFESPGCHVEITPIRDNEGKQASLTLNLAYPQAQRRPGLLGGLLRRTTPLPSASQFTLSNFTLTTSQPIAVEVAGSILAHTPITCTTGKQPLRIIVSRGTTTARS